MDLLIYDSYDDVKNYFEPLGSNTITFSHWSNKTATAPTQIYFSPITNQQTNKSPHLPKKESLKISR